jgi:hypothetical protein
MGLTTPSSHQSPVVSRCAGFRDGNAYGRLRMVFGDGMGIKLRPLAAVWQPPATFLVAVASDHTCQFHWLPSSSSKRRLMVAM